MNYDGKNACFAIRNHPQKALADIKHLSAAVERLTEERAVLHQRVMDLEEQLRVSARIARDAETALTIMRAGLS